MYHSSHSSSADMVKWFRRCNCQIATIQTQSSCSQANDSFVKVIQGNTFFILKFIQYQQLSYIFQHNSLW